MPNDDIIPSSSKDLSTDNTSSDPSIFVEKESAFQCIHVLTNDASSIPETDAALGELRTILDKYLELPSLLDQNVEKMVSEICVAAKLIMVDTTIMESSDSFWKSRLPRLLSSLYAMSKVRGRKRIQKFLPHQVEDVPVVLQALRAIDAISCDDHKTQDGPQYWESIYVLWNWMGMLSLVPFDSSVVVDDKSISDLLELGRRYLDEAGPTREMASVCLAGWLSRPDFEHTELVQFKVWAKKVLQDYATMEQNNNIFRVLGVLQTLVTILKTSNADRTTLLELVTPLVPEVMSISEMNPQNTLLRKYLVKWWTRAGTIYMPPRIAAWRYQRGRRSLEVNLSSSTNEVDSKVDLDPVNKAPKFFLVPDEVEEAVSRVISALTDPSTVVRWSAAKGVGRIVERLPEICSDDVLDALLEFFEDMDKDNDWHGGCLALAELARRGLLLPSRLNVVIPKIVQAIHYDVPRRQTSVGAHVRDAACYTYWAIARAYSPTILKPYVPLLSQSVVTAFLFDREINCRRAASAAFQEFVGRQGAKNFQHGIEILTTADYFTLGNRTEAFLTIAFQIAEYEEYSRCIVDHLYKIKLFHWDPRIRLLSSQSLGNLAASNIDYFVECVIPCLLQNSLDERNLNVRHGSVLGLAEIILSIGTGKDTNVHFENLLSKQTLSLVTELVPTIEKRRLYRGKGGEQMRAAVCRLIECIALAKIPLSVQLQVRLLDSIDACIPHPNEDIQESATLALFSHMRSYFPVSSKGPSDRLQKRVVDYYIQQVRTSINPAKTRGFSMALGRLPAKLLAPSTVVLDKTLACLCRIARPDATVGNDKDAETRRNALIALSRICETVGIQSRNSQDECISALTPKQLSHVFSAMFQGLDDYNVERRGDVGSMSRIAAMHGLVSLTQMIAESGETTDAYWDVETSTKLVGGILKQLAEKLDAVRGEAGKCLMGLLYPTNPTGTIKVIPEKQGLTRSLGVVDKDDINWANASVSFPIIVKALDIDIYFEFILSGLVISVGCLTQHVSKEAGDALLKWARLTSDENLLRLGKTLLAQFERHKHEGRVILPLLRTISLLANHMCIDLLFANADFSSALLEHLIAEEKVCKDVHRLTAILDVSLCLLGPNNDEAADVIAFACKFLEHSFPRVRRIAAENLYVRLLEMPDIEYDAMALDLLLSTPWDADDSQDKFQEYASNVARALRLDK